VLILNASLGPLALLGKGSFNFDSEDANKFIMRVCEVNTEIGNKILEKYLDLPRGEKVNGMVAPMASEIILSDW
jgi:hypothetical protein